MADAWPWFAAGAVVATALLPLELHRRLRIAGRRLFEVSVRLYESRRHVDRDRTAERRERDRLRHQILTARDRQVELEDTLRSMILGQQIIDAEQALAASRRAREALASDFGALGD